MLGSQLKSVYHFITASPNRIIVFASDLICTLFAIAYVLTLHTNLNSNRILSINELIMALFSILAIQASCCFACGLYRGLWRFASLPDLFRIIKACLLSTFILFF